MNDDLTQVLNALYTLEQENLLRSDYQQLTTPEQVAAALPADHPHKGDEPWAREQLEQLWIARKVMQIPVPDAPHTELRDVELLGLDKHGDEDGKLPLESNDVRGRDTSDFTQVAIYDTKTPVRYRSRVAEIARLLSLNYQRFRMAPGTGVLRYERRPQQRPMRNLAIGDLIHQWNGDISAGRLMLLTSEGNTESYPLRSDVQRVELSRAMNAVMQALAETLGPDNDRLARFQASSVIATLAGLYSSSYRQRFDAHVVTAGVGSGKSYAFQIGALIHAAYTLLIGGRGLRVLLVYPRVVLAANQFQDLEVIVAKVATALQIPLNPPVLDAGGQLGRQMGIAEAEKGGLFHAIQRAYGSGEFSILVSNLDTLANRIGHPEATRGLVENLDLIVCDEVHLLNGLYGSHARMLLKRLQLLREVWCLRADDPNASFSQLFARRDTVTRPYIVGASATIAQPAQHVARLIETETRRVMIVQISDPVETGWVHHFFLRQRPEVSTMTALVNATACLVHNRRDGLFREYYQRADGDAPHPLALDDLPNPIQVRGGAVVPRAPGHVHKTIGFCDSLDGVGRWADLVADNEGTKSTGLTNASPSGNYPYFERFQEPLWRVVHQRSFAAQPKRWQQELRRHYGSVCRNCKKGIRCSVPRVPPALNDAGRREVEKLWSSDRNCKDSYLHRMGIGPDFYNAAWFAPLQVAAQGDTIENLDGCAFFQAGLCWWWSMDHAGSNAPAPPSSGDPLNGVKMAGPRNDWQHHFVNGLRLQSFTSQKNLDVLSLPTINHLYQAKANEVLRDRGYPAQEENAALVIGSPRLEVGVDLSRVMDGLTYRAMRDPSSLQQKVGRVGRELGSDSLLVHLVTLNARDQYYFRNPQIALDPDYLQALPLHEDNRIVARHHFLMAIVDFIALQGDEPGDRKIANSGDRIALINDHAQVQSFSNWHQKVTAVHDFLFSGHKHRCENLENLRHFLEELGADPGDLTDTSAKAGLTPADSPRSHDVGVIDVFEHEFGPNFLLTPLVTDTGHPVTLAQLASVPYEAPVIRGSGMLPRHEAFLAELRSMEPPFIRRSYLRDVLCWPLFRRGLPERDIASDHPFVWTPNFFESVGTETVTISEAAGNQLKPLRFESVSTVLALLAPGTVTYRYGDRPCKVLVSRHHAQDQPTLAAPGIQRVLLRVDEAQFFEPAANCEDIGSEDLPPDFFGAAPLRVFTPRQLVVEPSRSQPLVLRSEGMMADSDSRTVPTGPQAQDLQEVMTPPRCYPLQWFRVRLGAALPAKPRFQDRLVSLAGGNPVPDFPLPPVLAMFSDIRFDPELAVTNFVWGLDRQFMSRQIDAARLVYRGAQTEGGSGPVAMGHRYVTPGMVFTVDTGPGSAIANFLDELVAHPESAVFQALLSQVLGAFLNEHAGLPRDPNAPWLGEVRPSPFTVRNLKAVVLFHLLRRWHPEGGPAQCPATPPVFHIADLAGCFQRGHTNCLEATDFGAICSLLADIHEPPSVQDHAATLRQTYPHFEAARGRIDQLDVNFFRRVALDLLLNSLGLTLHEAGLRLSGAERENLGYFYKEREGAAELFLFDKDAQGNGTTELLREHLFIPNAERALVERLRMLGQSQDPLPSRDFAQCLEDGMQECSSSHAAHLAFHAIDSDGDGAWRSIRGECRGERNRAGALYDFLHNNLGISSFDHLGVLRESPEFVARISHEYGNALVGSSQLPVYQSLESALGFCFAGCVSCLLSPEANLHGSLNAKESVNKLLLDAFYRRAVCEAGGALCDVCYPASGPGRTVVWGEQMRVAASALGRDADSFSAELILPTGDGGGTVSLVTPTVTYGGDPVVFRTGWEPTPVPVPQVRVRMEF